MNKYSSTIASILNNTNVFEKIAGPGAWKAVDDSLSHLIHAGRQGGVDVTELVAKQKGFRDRTGQIAKDMAEKTQITEKVTSTKREGGIMGIGGKDVTTTADVARGPKNAQEVATILNTKQIGKGYQEAMSGSTAVEPSKSGRKLLGGYKPEATPPAGAGAAPAAATPDAASAGTQVGGFIDRSIAHVKKNKMAYGIGGGVVAAGAAGSVMLNNNK